MNSPQSAVRSPQLISAAVLVVLCVGRQVAAQGQGTPPPQARHSTHEFTLPEAGLPPEGLPTNYKEWMVDVKSPGDGFTYVAGTITVNRTAPIPTQFSNANALPSDGPGFFAGVAGSVRNQRQVGILQIVDSATQVIGPQRYFYGTTVDPVVGPIFTRATNVRAISAWPTGVPSTTRVAICGETFDQILPRSNATSGWPLASAFTSSGFIAVFDGGGVLLWTHHFFGGNQGSSAVTDLSIRVDAEGRDIVTYCGISSHGNPTSNGTLGHCAPFFPPSSFPSPNPASGLTDNGADQWDGFVGRLMNPSSTPGATTRLFHSVVGGVRQDGLFGLAEIDTNRFVAVGSTGITPVTATGTATFPLDSVTLHAVTATYAIGVMMVFDASNVGALCAGNLILETGTALGNPNLGGKTVARDVIAQSGYGFTFPHAVVVGSTSDPALLAWFTGVWPAVAGPQATFGGGVDGFIVSALLPPSGVVVSACTFRGGEGEEILTGIGQWNEFVDHYVVAGRAPGTVTGEDIDVASFVIDTDAPVTYIGAPIVALTSALCGGAGADHPTAIGDTNATTLANFLEFDLGDPAGGGVAVDQTARVNVVGTTFSADYGVTTGPPNHVLAAGRNKTDITGAGIPTTNDGVRTVLDMLPARGPGVFGAVGRTDGTGELPTGLTTGLTYPLAGFFGGTTPECALQPFGSQIGVAAPAGSLGRMLIDYEGPVPAGGMPMTLVVTRPPGSSAFEVSAWQINFPGVTPNPLPGILPGGAVWWITGAAFTVGHVSADATLRFPFPGGLPVGAGTISVQLLSLPTGFVGGSVAGGPGPCTIAAPFVATPAMWLSY